MKKTTKISMAVLIIFTVVAASATFTGCSKGNAIGDEAVWQANVTERHIGPVDGSYANGVVMFRCVDSFWVDYMGQTYPSTHFCNSQYRLEGDNEEEIAALNGCYDLDTNTNQILGTSLTLTFLRDEVEESIVTLVGNTDPTDFRARFNKCHIGARSVCINPDEHTIVFKGVDENGDTAFARGRWYGTIHDTTVVVQHDTVPIHHYDTVWVDTGYVVRDTTFIVDTVTHDTIRYIVDSVVYSPAHISEANLVFVSNTLRAECANSITTTVYRDGQVYNTSSRNFSGLFDHLYSESGNYLTSHVGMALPVGANGTVNWGNGFSQSFQHQAHYTNPSGYEPWLRYLDCDFVRDSVYGLSNGILFVGHYVCPNGNHRKTYFFPKTPTTPDNPPTITRVDTLWLNCTTASASYIALTDQVQVAKNRTYRKINVWSDNHRDTSSAVYTATFNHLYNVIRVGQPTTSMATSVLVNVNSNTASFGGGAFTETLSSANGDRFCSDDWVSARLTTSGTEWNGNYGTSTYTVLIPETFAVAPPITGKRLIDGWVTYAYQTNTSAPEEWGVLYTEDLATGQRYFEYIPWHTGTVTYSEVTYTVTISSSDTNAIRTQINQGRYGARVYNHNSTSHQWLPGMTHSSQNGSSSSTSWTVTYWFVGGTEANHVDLIVATTDINSGDSRRGVWNGTVLSADNGTLYVSNL